YLYAFLPYLLVERLGKPNQAELRSGIGGAIGFASFSGNRAYIYDRAVTLRDHIWQQQFGEQHRRPQIQTKCLVPVLKLSSENRRALSPPCVVDQNINRSEERRVGKECKEQWA